MTCILYSVSICLYMRVYCSNNLCHLIRCTKYSICGIILTVIYVYPFIAHPAMSTMLNLPEWCPLEPLYLETLINYDFWFWFKTFSLRLFFGCLALDLSPPGARGPRRTIPDDGVAPFYTADSSDYGLVMTVFSCVGGVGLHDAPPALWLWVGAVQTLPWGLIIGCPRSPPLFLVSK